MEQANYDAEKCVHETIREINSRSGKWSDTAGKWVKSLTKEAKAKWYKADYDKCIRDKPD